MALQFPTPTQVGETWTDTSSGNVYVATSLGPPAVWVGSGSSVSLDNTYLRKDASNDPVTGQLEIAPATDTTGLVVTQPSGNTAAAMRITNEGSGDSLVIEDSANPDSSPIVADSAGRFLVGTTTVRTAPFSPAPIAQIESTGTDASLQITRNSNDSGGAPRLVLSKTRGTSVNSFTTVTAGTSIGEVYFSGADGSSIIPGAVIGAVAEGTIGANRMPAGLSFFTATNASPSVLTERMRIQSNGSYRLLNDTAVGFNQSQDITDINFEGRVWYSSSGSGTMQNIFRPKTVYVASGGNGLHYCGFDFIRVSPSGTPGNGSGPEVNMEFRGNTGFRILSGATYGTISDAKVKDNIVDATPKLSDLMQLQVRNFSLKGAPETKFIGFIAQELEEVFPTLVTSSKDYVMDEETGELVESDTETKGIKESALIPILVKSLQEAVARIEALEVEVASLKA